MDNTQLENLSVDQLQSRIDHLTKIKQQKEKPVILSNHDTRALQKVCQEYIDDLEEEGAYVDEDYPHWIFEAALVAFYGEDVWTWINKQLS